MELPTKTLKPTQRCCLCGDTHKMALGDRTYTCGCGNVMERDENAGRTMLRFAYEGAWWQKNYSAGTAAAAGCVSNAP